MGMLILEEKTVVWDENKARKNIRAHGIGFHEAIQAFLDPYLVLSYDEAHSSLEETRWKGLGMIRDSLLLMVCFTEADDELRLYSAREASPKEKRDYRDHINKIFGN
jgi:uncharacterized DUF497 family protein